MNVSKNPAQIAEAVEKSGITKSTMDIKRMFVLGILAGVYVGFAAQIATIVLMDGAQYVGNGLTKVVAGVVFSTGLILVVVGGAELFTGNSLICMPVLTGKAKLMYLLRNWGIVYLSNFIGSVLLVYLIHQSQFYTTGSNMLGVTALGIANDKVNLSWSVAFFRGILCNWLVCLGVWLAASAEDTTGKIMACIFPITAFVGSGYEHSVANMFFVPMGLALKNVPAVVAQSGLQLGNLTWTGFIVNNLIPVTLGNIVGGGFFVATLYGYVYCKRD